MSGGTNAPPVGEVRDKVDLINANSQFEYLEIIHN
jgi:hypothetical protein